MRGWVRVGVRVRSTRVALVVYRFVGREDDDDVEQGRGSILGTVYLFLLSWGVLGLSGGGLDTTLFLSHASVMTQS